MWRAGESPTRSSMLAGTTTAVTLDRAVQFGPFKYPFHVRSGSGAWDELARRLASLGADRFALVADEGVPAHLAAEVQACLRSTGVPVITIQAQAREDAKTWAAAGEVMAQITGGGATRQSVVIALGGGTVGNLAGLAAALVFRGIRFVNLPTTFLAASDSALSLKQGINGPDGKNHLGTFWAPELVWCELAFLAALPADEIRSGLCELVKNALVITPGGAEWAAGRLRPDARYTPAELCEFIDFCVSAKTTVMRHDEHERREALALEYGHTTGHAVEFIGGIRHGYAVGLGMLAAGGVAAEMGFLPAEDLAVHRALLAANGAPLTIPADLATADILAVMRGDNKRGYIPPQPGHIDMVLLSGLGGAARDGGPFLTQVPERIIAHAIDQQLRPGSAA